MAPHQCSRDDTLYFITNEVIYYVTMLINSRCVSLFSISTSPVSYPTQKIISKLIFCTQSQLSVQVCTETKNPPLLQNRMHHELHYVLLPYLLDRTFEASTESQREKDHRRRLSCACVWYTARGCHPLSASQDQTSTYGGTAKHHHDLNARERV